MTATRTSPPASPPEWAPGFVKRGPRFKEYVSRAASWTWGGETIVDLMLALGGGGARDLTPQELKMLLVYASHLNWEAIQQENDACVWPSTSLIYDLADFSEAAGRRIRGSLEAKGYLVRWFNGINRPKGEEAVDLAILMSRLGELQDAIDVVRQDHRDRRAAQRASQDLERGGEGDQGGSSMGPQAPTDEPQKQTQRNDSSEVRGSDAPAARSRSKAPAARGASGRGSDAAAPRSRSKAPAARGAPGAGMGSNSVRDLQARAAAGIGGAGAPRGGARVSVSGPHPPSVRAQMALQELQLAVQVSPRIAALVPPHVLENPAAASLGDAEDWARAAGQLLPDPKRNNAETFRWAWRTHGVRALAMLALAIEDRQVEKPANWFGGMAKTDPGRLDLRPNFARILRERGQFPRQVAGTAPAAKPTPAAKKPLQDPERFFDVPGGDDPIWRAIDAELRRRVKTGTYGSYFERCGFGGLKGGVLHLVAATGHAASKIQRELSADVRAAARAAGHEFVRLVVIRRADWDEAEDG